MSPIVGLLCLFALAPPHASTDPNLLAAESHIQREEWSKAAEALELVLQASPGRSPEPYLMLAVCHMNLDATGAALSATERGLAQFPGSTRLLKYWIELLARALPPALVQRRLESALEKQPASPDLQLALGRLLLDRRVEDPRIASLLNSARRSLPGSAEAQFLYGRWACLHQQEELCVTTLNKALTLTPAGNLEARLLINGMAGLAHERRGDPKSASLAYQRALDSYRHLERAGSGVPMQYVKFLVAQDRMSEAEKVTQLVLARDPGFYAAHLEQAKFLLRRNEAAKAVEEANEALRLCPPEKMELRAVHSFLAKANAALGRNEQARLHQQWVDANQ